MAFGLLGGGNALATPVQTTTYRYGGIPRYGNLLSENRPDELDQQAQGGFEGGSVGQFDPQSVNTQQEHGLVDTPVGSISARDAIGGLMGMGGTFGGLQDKAMQGSLAGLQAAFGPHGVTGMYGSPSLDQISSQQARDAMATNAARNAMAKGQISPQAAFGNRAAPVHGGFMAHDQTANNALSTFGNALGGLLGFNDQAPSPAQALGEVASGRSGRRGRGDPSRGANAGTSGGRGRDGGLGGGVGDVGAGNPGGTGVL